MPDGFEFPRSELLWTPLVADPDGEAIRASVFGRLRDGVSPDAAQSELDVIATNMAAEFPETHRDITISVHPFAHAELGDGEAALMLYSMTLILSFVLVVACVNVSHLLLARAIDRNREMALRMALGASRARVLGIVLSESLLLSAAGGVAGVALTYGSVAWLDSRLGAVISLFWASIEVDIAVLAFAAILVVLSALLGGLLPARLASSVDLIDAIKERSSTASGLRASRTTRALVSVQIAFSCGLLILSGLMVKGVVGLATRELAFEPDGVVTGRVELREFDYPTAEHRLAFVDDLQRGLVGPQIEGVAFASGLPGLGPTLRRFALESEDAGPPREAGVLVVSPAFFSTFRTELVSGRLLSQAEDERRSARTALVTDVFAAQFLGDGSVLGRRFRFDDETGGDMVDDTWIQIVGVVRDGGVFAEGELARPGVFLALAQEAPASLSVSLRTSDVSSAAALLRSTVAARDADLPLYEVSTLRDALHQASTVQRTFGDMFGVFGLIALLMAVVGLYAMVAYGVKRRTHEVGMRRALGASQANIVRLLLRSAAIPLVAGLAAGVAIASIIAPALGAALFGVSPRDPLVYVVVVSVLFAAALFAALLPSIEAARVHPMRALRAD
jgi:predicted permease